MLEPYRPLLWYEKPAFVIAALIVFWPVGLGLMWSRRLFSEEARARITVAAPLLTILLIVALVSGPPSALNGAGEPAQSVSDASRAAIESLTPTGTAPPAPAPAIVTTPAPAASVADTSATSPASAQTPDGGTIPLPAPQAGPVQARFTLEGTYTNSDSGSTVTFTLVALPYDNIVSYEWWVNAGGSTATYTGANVRDTYQGMPPTSVRLMATASNGKTYPSEASVEATGGRIYAAVR